MAMLDRYRTEIGNDSVVVRNAAGQPITLPRSMWDEVVNESLAGQKKSLSDFQDILNNPNNPFYNHPGLSKDVIQSQINQAQSNIFDPNNISPDRNVTLTANLLQKAGLGDSANAWRDSEVMAQRAKDKNSGIGGLVTKVVPAGIALGSLFLGGTALAPGLMAGATPAVAAKAAATAPAATGGGLSSFASSIGSTLGKASLNAALKGAGIGAVGGLQSGGLEGALKGAALGGVTGGFGSGIAGSLGLSGIPAETFKSALTGASGGIANGDLTNAAIGGLTAGAGGYLGAGGSIPGLGTLPGAPLSTGAQGATQGSGLLKNLSEGANTMGLFSGGGSGTLGNLGKLFSVGSDLYSGYTGNKSIKKMQQQMLDSQRRAESAYAPYSASGTQALQSLSGRLASGFSPQDITSDQGYQFRLKQGEDALARRLAAQGLSGSGSALKAAQDYGQGLASTAYNDAYNQWLQQNSQLGGLAGQGMGAASSLADVYGNTGNIMGMATLGRAENKNKMLSSLFSPPELRNNNENAEEKDGKLFSLLRSLGIGG